MPGPGVWIRPFRNGYRVYFREVSGGVLGGSREFGSVEAAETLAAELRTQIAGKRVTVERAVGEYSRDAEARGLRASTIGADEKMLRGLLEEVWESPLGALSCRRAEALYEKLAKSGRWAPATHHLALAVAKRWAKWCIKRRWMRVSPWEAVEKIGEAADNRSNSLRIDEARAFRDKAMQLAKQGDDGAISTLIALTCSLRPGEIVQITARDVDDGGAVLWVAGANLKTRNTRRPIAVEDADLRALLARLARGKQPDEILIPHHPRYVARAAERIATAAGVPAENVNARMLRRTFATLAARRGRSLDDLAFGMGHGADAKAKTAQRHYLAPGARQAGEAGRVLGVLDGGKAKQRRKRPT